MLIGIIGENCSGKSTLAAAIRQAVSAEIITGRDYLRMAKSESEAVRLFREKLLGAVSGENLIYVISEPEQIRQTRGELWEGRISKRHLLWKCGEGRSSSSVCAVSMNLYMDMDW